MHICLSVQAAEVSIAVHIGNPTFLTLSIHQIGSGTGPQLKTCAYAQQFLLAGARPVPFYTGI